MYKKFYGLKESPFNLTPDTRFLYLSKGHKEALAHLVYGIGERKGFMVITGEVGSGKTTLCRALVNQLGENTKVALILNSFLSETELLKSINEEFFLKSDNDSKKVLIDELNKFLIKEHSQGHNVVLIIDEAQNLSPETLEQIRMISNLETETDKLLQIVLMGQPEFNDVLMLPGFKQLNQRITVRYHLEAIDKDEILLYIQHRLKVAGAQKNITFDNEAVELLYEFSNGIPRLINIACDRCLLSGFVKNATEITAEIMKEAINEVAGKYALGLTKGKRDRRLVSVPLSRKQGFFAKEGYDQVLFRWIALIVFVVFASIIGYGLLKSSNKLIYIPTIDEKVLLSALSEGSRSGKNNKVDKVLESVETQSVASLQLEKKKNSESNKSSQVANITGLPNTPPEKTQIQTGTIQIVLQESEYNIHRAIPFYLDWEKDENNIVRVNNRNFTQLASIATLLSVWNIDVDLSIFRNATLENVLSFDIIQFTKDAGANRVDFQTDFTQLIRLDIPVILEMDKNNLYVSPYVVLTGVTNQELIVADPIFGKMKIKRGDLDKIWFGNAIAIFIENNISSQLSSGMRGKEVGILQQYLKRLGYFQNAITNKFDKYTKETLKKFQKDNNLPDDGICGSMTLMVIGIRLKGREIPILTKDIAGGLL